MSEAKKYGWTGQGLRINLTTGEITKVPTQKDWIGGTALGYKIFWDEVPPKTQAFDEANKIVIAPGPLTGTGAVCSGRTSVTTMYPTTYPIHEIGSAHLGGDLGAKMKYAGYDFIVTKAKPKNRYTFTSITTMFRSEKPIIFGVKEHAVQRP